MDQDEFDRNIRAPYFSDLKRTASARVLHGSPPRETEVTFEHYSVAGVEFVALRNSEIAGDVRVFVSADLQQLQALLERAIPSRL